MFKTFFNTLYGNEAKISTTIEVAEKLKEDGDPRGALTVLMRLVKENPDCEYCRYRMGKMNQEIKNLEQTAQHNNIEQKGNKDRNNTSERNILVR